MDIYQNDVVVDDAICSVELLVVSDAKQGQAKKHVGEIDGGIIAYSVCEQPWQESVLGKIEYYHSMISNILSNNNRDIDGCPILILGTKVDRAVKRVIEVRDGMTLAKELGCLFGECSAKEGDVDYHLIQLLRVVMEQR